MVWMTALMVAITMGFGFVAVQHWRSAQIPWWKGLGLHLDRWTLYDLGIGFLISALAMVSILALGSMLGVLQVDGLQAPDASFWTEILKRAASAFQEEFIFRSLMLSGMVLLFRRPWLALAVNSVLFGLAHAANPSASGVSVVGNSLDGFLYGIAFLWSGRIWLPFALHFSWNYAQGPVLGFPVSGFDMGGLVRQKAVGSTLVTGGSYGPEGGLLGRLAWLIALALVVGWLAWSRRHRPAEGTDLV
jgi:membrane protease YdiL (CAAX protease family)